MSTIEITSKIEALKDLEALIEEAKAEAETLRDEIKQEMLNQSFPDIFFLLHLHSYRQRSAKWQYL